MAEKESIRPVAGPRPVAQPKAPAPKRVSAQANAPISIRQKRRQEDFSQEAAQLCERFGFVGEDDWVIHDIRIVDARNYFLKVLHEAHQAAHNQGVAAPTAQAVVEHLKLDDDNDAEEFIAIFLQGAAELGGDFIL